MLSTIGVVVVVVVGALVIFASAVERTAEEELAEANACALAELWCNEGRVACMGFDYESDFGQRLSNMGALASIASPVESTCVVVVALVSGCEVGIPVDSDFALDVD